MAKQIIASKQKILKYIKYIASLFIHPFFSDLKTRMLLKTVKYVLPCKIEKLVNLFSTHCIIVVAVPVYRHFVVKIVLSVGFKFVLYLQLQYLLKCTLSTTDCVL